ncbi:MAG: hypothetical protein Q9227_004445 [Pyrenula ochraceoflavens]
MQGFLILVAFWGLALSEQCGQQKVPLLARNPVCGITQDVIEGIDGANLSAVPLADTAEAPQASTQAGPWTHPLICTQTLEYLGTPLCIYTLATFASGRGITILTQPVHAEEILKLCKSAESTPDLNANTNTWQVTPLPGRGMGVLSTRPLNLGDKIMSYTPILIALRNMQMRPTDLEYLLERAVSQLPPATSTLLRSLARSLDHPDSPYSAFPLQDIMQTNSFALSISSSTSEEIHMALYPATARINHSCAPNSQYRLITTATTTNSSSSSSNSLLHQIHAARPIPLGSELTISYHSPLSPTTTRQSDLHSNFHFTCTCPRCLNPSLSDSRLTRIQHLESTLSDFSASATARLAGTGPKLAMQLVKLYQEEGLDAVLVRPYGLLAQEFAALGEGGKARRYARVAGRYGRLKEGEEGGDVREMRELAEGRVEGHWAWGLRSGREGGEAGGEG